MLRVTGLTIVLLVLQSCTNENSWLLCPREGNRPPLEIDFIKQKVISADVIFEIAPCDTDIKNCFSGPFDFIDPRGKIKINQPSVTFESIIEKKDSIYNVRNVGEYYITKYLFSDRILEINITRIDTGKSISYYQCG